MNRLHEKLLDDDACQMISTFDLQDNRFVKIAESNEWETIQITTKAAKVIIKNRDLWIPKSAIGFSPSGDLFVKEWFFSKEF